VAQTMMALPPPAPETPLLKEELAALLDRMLREAVAVVSGTEADGGPAMGSGVAAEVEPSAVFSGPGETLRVDFGVYRSPTELLETLRALVAWMSDPTHEIGLNERDQAWLPLLIAASFPKDGVSKLLIVDDGPQTIMPYRLTHDVGVISQDFLFLDGPAEHHGGRLELLGVGPFDALSVIGWVSG